MVLEKPLESPLNCKEIKPVHPKGNQPWIFIGGTNAEVEAPIFWPPDAKSKLIGKDPDMGKAEGKRRRCGKGWDGWMASLTQRNESEQTQGDSDGQRSLACCSSCGRKESDMTYWLNNNKKLDGLEWETRPQFRGLGCPAEKFRLHLLNMGSITWPDGNY